MFNNKRPTEGAVYESVWDLGGVEKVHLVTIIAVGVCFGDECFFYTIDSFPGEIGWQYLEYWDAFRFYLSGDPIEIDSAVTAQYKRGEGLFFGEFWATVFKRGNQVFLNDADGKALLCLATKS